MTDLEFLESRRRFAATWNVVGVVLIVALVALGGWLFLTKPQLANPMWAAGQVAQGLVEQPTLELTAVLLPAKVLGYLGGVAVVILLGFLVFANERRYLRTIDDLRAREGKGPAATESRPRGRVGA